MKQVLPFALISLAFNALAEEQVNPGSAQTYEARPPVNNPVVASELPHVTPAPQNDGRLERLERAVGSLERQISAIVQVSPSSPEGSARAGALAFAQVEELKEQVRQLRGDIEQVQFENTKVNEKLTRLSSDMDFRFNEIAKTHVEKKKEVHHQDEPTDKAATKKVDGKPNNKEKASVEDEYQSAYALIKANDFKGARAAFLKFIDDHPETEYTSNAYYWLGETYYLKSEHDKAAGYYLKGYQSNAKGSRAADNLLKLAKSLAKLDKQKEACTTYAKLKKEFPNASNSILKLMEDDMKQLKCRP